jgi:predicted nucleic acid-binding protein
VTSVVTLIEVLIHPIRSGREDLARQYRDILLHSKDLTTIPLREEIAEEAARLRAVHGLRTPDAIQLATALTSDAAFFLTNDLDLPTLPKLKVLTLDQL